MVKDLTRKIILGAGGIGLALSVGTCVGSCDGFLDLGNNESIIPHAKTQEVLEYLELKKKTLSKNEVYIPTEFYSNSKVDGLNEYVSSKKVIDTIDTTLLQKLDSAIYETKEDLDSLSNSPEYRSMQSDIVNYFNKMKNSFWAGVASMSLFSLTILSYYLPSGKDRKNSEFLKNN
jgi:hypothetical protein